MSCKCPPPTTGGAVPELGTPAADLDNGPTQWVPTCPPGFFFEPVIADCIQISAAPPPQPEAPAGTVQYHPSGLPELDGNGDGEAIDYTPEEQPFPWVALLVGVGAVLLAARR